MKRKRKRNRRRPTMPMATPPTGVAVVLHNGQVLPCDIAYEAFRGGVHVWVAVPPVPVAQVERVQTAVLPAYTRVVKPRAGR